MVFGGLTTDGRRMGEYIEWVAGQESRRQKAWRYRIAGRLMGKGASLPFMRD
jgi:hypothetical protein